MLKAKSIDDTKNRHVVKFKYRESDLRQNVKYVTIIEIGIATFISKS